MADAPRVSVIVPLAGGPAQALRCLEGIAAIEGASYETIVVDDASVGLAPLLDALAGDVSILRSDRRIGFAAAAQLGLSAARGEIVALLRDGAAPLPGWLAPLLAALRDPSVGLAASVCPGAAGEERLSAFAFAARRAQVRDIQLSGSPPTLAVATIALALAERGLRTIAATDSLVAPPGARAGGARRAPGEPPELTIVIPTLDALSDRLHACLAALQASTDVAHQVVIVDNGCPPQGFAAPVNAGIRAASTPYVVVMNDDVEPLQGWWEPLRSTLEAGASVAFPLTVEGAMRRDFAAWCFAMSSETARDFGHAPDEFFDPSLVVWYQDTDLLLRLREAGRPPVLVERSRIRHGLSQTVNSEDEQLRAWVREQTALDRDAFVRKHPDAGLEVRVLGTT